MTAGDGTTSSPTSRRGRRASPGSGSRRSASDALPAVSRAQELSTLSGRKSGRSGVTPDDFRHVDHHRGHHGNGHHGGHHGGHYGYYGYYGHGFHFGVYLGYPHYYSIGYPYYGYYSYYSYPYLDSYGCDFYDGFYVRFGSVGVSYYSACPRFGVHGYHGRHQHRYSCAVHGYHYYHVRDCAKCYPDGGVHYEYHDAGNPGEAEREAPLLEKKPLKENLDGGADTGPSDPLADLTPAKLSFALGLRSFQEGHYDKAAEFFFNASVEDPDSRVVRLMLAVSLLSISEDEHAASFLRMAYEAETDSDAGGRLDGLDIDLRRLYGEGRVADFEALRKRVRERADLYPSDPNALLVDGFVALGSADYDRAAVSFNAFQMFTVDDVDRALGARLVAAAQSRAALPANGQSDAIPSPEAVHEFLRDPGLRTVRDLPIR